MPDRTTAFAATFELGLILAGLFLIWRVVVRPASRGETAPPALERWEVSFSDFCIFFWLVCAGATAGFLMAGFVFKHLPFSVIATNAGRTAAVQLGILAAIGLFNVLVVRHHPRTRGGGPSIFVTGLATFLVAMPVVTVTNLAWQAMLRLCGIEAERQPLIQMFQDVNSPWLLGAMIVLACVGAPLTEELVFRSGIFRYMRTRMPRWVALLAPAALFAALHENLSSSVPLVALGVLFSLAYERTGRIGTCVVAHALFNLNSLALVFAKVEF